MRNNFHLSLQLACKRMIDIVASTVALLLLTPVFAMIAIAIRIDSPGSFFFTHLAAGRDGKPFSQWKFRTMTKEAGQRGNPFEISAYDPRITRIGHFLRRWSLDELPQLWNVIRGDMSLIGPRPNFAETAARYSSYEMQRLSMRPGLTGLAQIHGRNLIPWHERVPLDITYIEDYSLWLDAKIAIWTLPIWLRGEGIYGADGFVRVHALTETQVPISGEAPARPSHITSPNATRWQSKRSTQGEPYVVSSS